MPEFSTPFAGMNASRKLTKDELVRAMRFNIAAEYEAAQLYLQLADSIDDELSKTVLRDVAEEELVHAGEFLSVLKRLHPEEDRFYADGAREVDEMAQKLKRGKS